MPKKKSKGTVKKQRGGMTPSDPTRNPNQRGAINQQVRAGRRERGRLSGLGGYGGPSLPPGRNRPQDFPNPRQLPPQGPGPVGQYGIDPARMADLNRRMGAGATRRPTGPPRRPPPPIRPGYNVGGPVPETNALLTAKKYQGGGMLVPPSLPFMGGVAGGPPGRRPTLGPQPRRRRGRGRGGRDV